MRALAAIAADRSGAVLAELALALTVLVPVIMGSAELARFVLLEQKLQRLATTVGDLNARGDVLTVGEVTALFDAVPHIMDPFAFADRGTVIVSSVSTIGVTYPEVAWQQQGGGTLDADSHVGEAGQAATLPVGFTMAANQSAIITEVVYRYEPLWLGSLISARQLEARSLYRPRLSDQTVLQ